MDLAKLRRLALAVTAGAGMFGAAAASAQTQIGAWSVSLEDSGASRPVKTAILVAADGASLIAACDARGIDVLVSYVDTLPKAAALPVEWRIGGGPAHRQSWQEAADQSSLSPGGPEVDAGVLKQIARGRSLTFVAAGRRSTFDLTGARQVTALLGACPPVTAPAAAAPDARTH
jgi:hypothetical protein